MKPSKSQWQKNFITKQKEMNRLDSEISKLQQIISNEGDKGSEINVEAIALGLNWIYWNKNSST